MENKTPTAEEFLIKENLPIDILSGDDINYAMVAFAKLHVEEALKEASEDANMDSDYYQALQVYPLTNIK